jgi:UDP-2,3-diacylglucosamine hydrolase
MDLSVNNPGGVAPVIGSLYLNLMFMGSHLKDPPQDRITGMKQCDPIYIISDVHLGCEDPPAERRKEDRLLGFLDRIQEDASRLIILGDLFDFWFEYRRMVDMSYFAVLAGLWQIRKRGIRVDYFLGNHDYWTTGFFSSNLADAVHAEPVPERFGNKRALLAHGDGISEDEKSYLFMKRILRHPASRALFRILHPDIGAWLAHRTSRTSRNREEAKRIRGAKILREYAQRQIEAGAFDWIIAGHSHHPERTEFGSGVYLNTGDWSRHFTFGIIRGEDIRLERWDD